MAIANARVELRKTEIATPPSLSDSIAEGTEIAGRYRILSLIAEGGMGAVYRAEHLQLRKVFALKVLHARNADRPLLVARFEREAIAAGRIEHPNVVPATDFGKLPDGSFFLVMEFVNGRSLRSELKAGAMRPPRALGIMRGVVAGLSAAHEKGIVHRDLKPENVMLVERDGDPDFVKLLDFGVARIDSEKVPDRGPHLTESGAMLGTPQYMSPEQILGRAIDARSDLYSLGVILFELLTGRCPFAGNLALLLEQHVTAAPPEMPPALAAKEPRLAEIVRALLAKDPDNRFQTASDLAAALEEALYQRSGPSDVRAALPVQAGGALVLGVGRSLRDLGRRAQTLLAKVASSTSAIALQGVSSVRDYAERSVRHRRDRSHARGDDHWVARTVIGARPLGHQRTKSGRRLVGLAKMAWSRTIAFCRKQLQLHARGWMLVVWCLAALALIVVLWMVQSWAAAGGPEGSESSDRESARPSRTSTGETRSTSTTTATRSRLSVAPSSQTNPPPAGAGGSPKSRR